MNEAQRSERRVDRLVGRQLRDRFRRGGADDILRTYLRLHERTGKIIGEHWLWCALHALCSNAATSMVQAEFTVAVYKLLEAKQPGASGALARAKHGA